MSGDARGSASDPRTHEALVRARLRVNLLRVATHLRAETKLFLEPFGLTPAQFTILRILRANAPRPLSTLCLRKRMIDAGSDTSRLVDRLAEKGLVVKDTCCGDRRRLDVTITDAGRVLLARIEEDLGRLDEVFDGLDADELESLDALLDRVGGAPLAPSSDGV